MTILPRNIRYASMATPLQHDHVFVLVEPQAQVADRLLDVGLREGPSIAHPGQGTANRRFFFDNGMLEFLYVHNVEEARKGPARDLHFPERSDKGNPANPSPFGVIFLPSESAEINSDRMPFSGWHYQPDYFPPPTGFHVGTNSQNLAEPLCIFFPTSFPKDQSKPQPPSNPQTITDIVISTPAADTEGVLATAFQADRLLIQTSHSEHLMEITLDNHARKRTEDFRPSIPLILNW